MAHIHTNDGDHDYTVGAYIVLLGANPKVLLHMHLKMGMLFPIGGHIELNETPWQAIAREIKEESGYSLTDLKILQPKNTISKLSDIVAHPLPVVVSDQDVSTVHFHTDLAYAFTSTRLPEEVPLEGESSDLRWLDKDELMNLSPDQIFENTKEIYAYILDECLRNWIEVDVNKYVI